MLRGMTLIPGRRLVGIVADIVDETDDDDLDVCCAPMRFHLTVACGRGHSALQCPDRLVVRMTDGSYGLPLRDGEASSATSVVGIACCPWCGALLPGWPAASYAVWVATGEPEPAD